MEAARVTMMYSCRHPTRLYSEVEVCHSEARRFVNGPRARGYCIGALYVCRSLSVRHCSQRYAGLVMVGVLGIGHGAQTARAQPIEDNNMHVYERNGSIFACALQGFNGPHVDSVQQRLDCTGPAQETLVRLVTYAAGTHLDLSPRSWCWRPTPSITDTARRTFYGVDDLPRKVCGSSKCGSCEPSTSTETPRHGKQHGARRLHAVLVLLCTLVDPRAGARILVGVVPASALD